MNDNTTAVESFEGTSSIEELRRLLRTEYDNACQHPKESVNNNTSNATSAPMHVPASGHLIHEEIFDNALLMADFLTSNYKIHGSARSEKENNSNRCMNMKRNSKSAFISPWDLVSAIQYRNDIESYHHVQSIMQMMPSNEIKSKLEIHLKKEQEQIWKRKQNRINVSKDQPRLSPDEDTILAIEKFEVWTTKLIATEFLLYHPSSKHKKSMNNRNKATTKYASNYPSCSTLLNMASGDYFNWVMPPCKFESQKTNKSSQKLGENTKTCNGQAQHQHQTDSENVDMAIPSLPSKIPIMHEHYRGTLAISPNSLTWKEYLRLSVMVSSLSLYTSSSSNNSNNNNLNNNLNNKDSPIQEASKSIMTQSIYTNPYEGLNPQEPTMLNSSCKKQYVEMLPNNYKPADLVALWVRAQRNTCAFLHMIDLFEVKKVKTNKSSSLGKKNHSDTGKDADENHIHKEHDDEYQYIAKCIGNSKKFKKYQIEKEASLVNKLMNWAIINQVLFTYERMRDELFEQMKITNGCRKSIINKRKRCGDNEMICDGKRRKFDSTPTCLFGAINDSKVQQAIKVFILRLFATRNRNILKVIYSSDVNGSKYDTADFSSDLQDLPEKVKKHLKNYCNGSTNRTLARIDRRIMLENFFEDENAFEDVITSLLTALRYALPSDNEQLMKELAFAENDFRALCNEPSSLLKHFDFTDGQTLCNQLLSFPAPWIEKCIVCENEKKGILRTCMGCERSFHPSCQMGCTKSEPKPLIDCGMLSSLYWSPNLAKEIAERPSFTRGDKSIQWEEVSIHITRNSVDDPWGMQLFDTESCMASLKDIEMWLEHGNNILPLLHPSRDPPLCVPFTGMIAYSVNDKSPAGMSGLKAGDVIISIESDGTKINFRGIDEHERIAVVRQKVLSFELVVHRPTVDIIEKSSNFQSLVDAMVNKIEETHHSYLEDRWYCEQCSKAASTITEQEKVKRNSEIDEAKLCRALISRLSVEWSSLPFHDETIIDDCKVGERKAGLSLHFSFSSLRRLYEMMDHIIAGNPCQSSSTHTSPFTVLHSSKSQNNKESEQLMWANGLQSKPFLLLCRGVDCILRSKLRSETYKECHQQLSQFKELFVKFFVSWCLDRKTSKLFPAVTFTAIDPWIAQACCICKVRQKEHHSNNSLCSSKECIRIFEEQSSGSNEKNNESQGDIDNFINHPYLGQLQYDLHSSFVGTSILVLPNDPLLETFEKKAEISLVRSHGPFQLLVASFVPSFYLPEELSDGIVREETHDKGSISDEIGVYYLIPIISAEQLKYILQFCQMRDIGKTDPSWIYQKIWGIPGIFILTPSELQSRMKSSKLILGAIESAIFYASTYSNQNDAEWSNDKSKDTDTPQDRKENSTESGSNLNSFGRLKIEHCVVNSFDEDLWSSEPFSMLSDSNKNQSQGGSFKLVDSIRKLVLLNETFFIDQNVFQIVSMTGRNNLLLDKDASHLLALKAPSSGETEVAIHLCFDKRVLQGLTIFRHDEAVSNKLCKLWYSDLLYWEFRNNNRGFWTNKRCKAMRDTEEVVVQQTLQNPISRGKSGRVQSLQFLLQRLYTNEPSVDEREVNNVQAKVKYQGIGWGLELVQWDGEECTFRVGRIAPNSPASEAGFKTDDIIVSINGALTSNMNCMHSLCQHILGERIKNNLQSKNTRYPFLISLHRLTKAVVGPIFVNVIREEFVTPTSLHPSDQLETSVLRTEQFSHCSLGNTLNERNYNLTTLPNCEDEAALNHDKGDEQTKLYQSNESMEHLNTNSNKKSLQYNETASNPVQQIAQDPLNPTFGDKEQNKSLYENQLTSIVNGSNKTGQSRTSDLNHNNHSSYPTSHTHSLSRVSHLLKSISSYRAFFNVEHLYRPCFNNSVFTIAETSVYLTALENNQPRLGSRLLRPRYCQNAIDNEIGSIIAPLINDRHVKFLEMIPKLSSGLWAILLRADYKRSFEESGGVIERKGDSEYKADNKVLHIDRIFESTFREWRNGTYCEDTILLHMSNEIMGPCSNSQHPNIQQGYHRTPMHPQGIYRPTLMQQNDSEPIENHQNDFQSNDSANLASRIRGGGDDDDDQESIVVDQIYQPLSHVPQIEWSDLPIFGICTITRGETRENNVFLGKVHNFSHESREVFVRMIFISSHGNISRICAMDADNIFMIPTCGKSCGDADVISKYLQIKKSVHDFLFSSSNSQGEFGIGTESGTNPLTSGKNQAESSTDNFVSSTLGYLPDNRIVKWFPCDPAAIYLCSEDNDEANFLTHKLFNNDVKKCGNLIVFRNGKKSFNLSPCEESKYTCIWGCSKSVEGDIQKRKLLGFKTEEDLKYHLKQHHCYGTFPTLSKWERVNHGNAMQELCLDITSHICSKIWIMGKFCHTLLEDNNNNNNNNRNFDKSPFGKRLLVNHEMLLGIFQNKEYCEWSRRGAIQSDTHDLMKLLSKLYQLFAVETSGAFRKGDKLFGSHISSIQSQSEDHSEKEENSFISHLEKNISAEINNDRHKCNAKIRKVAGVSACKFASMDTKLQMNCDLCRINNENMFTFFQKGKPNVHGIGCALLTDVYDYKMQESYNKQRLQQAIKSLPFQKDLLCETKLLLLKVAANVPNTLYQYNSKKLSNMYNIWDELTLERWIQFLTRCVNCRMLSQAYVVLLISINIDKMPVWWKSAKAGWASSFVIMQIQSLSGLALHLYTFDVAVASSAMFSNNSFNNKDENEDETHEDDDPSIPKTVEITTASYAQVSPNKKFINLVKHNARTHDVKSFHYESCSHDGNLTPRETTSLSLQLKMNQVLRWADEESVQRFRKTSTQICLRCGEGGKVIQCELCSNAVHGECVGHVDSSNEFELVCDECINSWFSKKQDEASKTMMKMKQVIKWSEEAKVPRFNGEHGDDCMFCDEVGQVLLCEFCPNVVHQECIGYQGSIHDIDYVCLYCVEKWYSKRPPTKAIVPKSIPHYIPFNENTDFPTSRPLIVKCKRWYEGNIEKVDEGDKNQLVLEDNNSQLEDMSIIEIAEESNSFSFASTSHDDEDNRKKSDLILLLEKEAELKTDHGARCKLLLSCSDKDKVKQIIQWGDEVYIPRKSEHEHCDFCANCGNGEGSSSWYKCEYCENVVHRECCQLKGNFEGVEFMCNECMIDMLSVLRSSESDCY